MVAAVRNSNLNVSGNVLESNGAWLIVRGVGLLESVDDIKRIVIAASNGVPVFVEQVANVQIGDAFRVASLVKGSEEAVGGVVVARAGVNTKDVIDAVKLRIAQIAPGLPKDVRIVPFYDRSELIEQATGTLRTALIEEIVLVTLAHVIFLMHFRSILIVTIPLPLAVLISFLGMHYAGISSNIMSLAGIAIAIGVLVDAGIVVTENAFRSVEQRGIDPRDRTAVWEAVRDSTRLVGAARLLFDGDHPAGLHPGVCANRPGRETVPPACLHQDVCRAGRDGDRRDARAGALHVAAGRTLPRGGSEPCHAAAAAPDISRSCGERWPTPH